MRLTTYAAVKVALLSLFHLCSRHSRNKEENTLHSRNERSCHHCHVTRQGQYCYWVKERETVEERLPQLCNERTKMPRVIFCRQCEICAAIYDFFLSTLKHEFTEPVSASLHIVVCTIAFGMGVDCAGVNQVIHWRPSADVESYMQECGRAG